MAYGENIEYMGPIYSGMTIEGGTIRVKFAHVGTGLKIGNGATVLSSTADTLAPFEIAGSNNVYYAANAVIDGNTVVVSCPSVSSPKNVRYAAHTTLAHPEMKATLYNSANLPASPLRSYTWAGLSAPTTAVSAPGAMPRNDRRVVWSKPASVRICSISGRLFGQFDAASEKEFLNICSGLHLKAGVYLAIERSRANNIDINREIFIAQ